MTDKHNDDGERSPLEAYGGKPDPIYLNVPDMHSVPAGEFPAEEDAPIRTILAKRPPSPAAQRAYQTKLHRRVPPFLRQGDTLLTFAIDICIAVLPLYLFAWYLYGARVLVLALLSVVTCLGAEYLCERILRNRFTLTNGSALVTGLILPLFLPASSPLWLPVAGGLFAIIVIKELFGGLGKNLVNPALSAYAFLMLSWNGVMTAYPKPFSRLPVFSVSVDSAALVPDTTLTVLRAGKLPEAPIFEIFLGNKPGALGAVSGLLLLGVFLYLLVRRTVRIEAFAGYIFAAGALFLLFPRLLLVSDAIALQFTAIQLSSGSLLLCAVFAVSDPATTPRLPLSRLIFGIGCGVLTVLLRYFGASLDGAPYAVLVMSLLSPMLDSVCRIRHVRHYAGEENKPDAVKKGA